MDGQNLFHSAWEAFGSRFPNYDPVALARAACEGRPWTVSQVRFYTGVPNPTGLILFFDRIGVDFLDAVRAKIEVNRRSYPVEASKARSEPEGGG